MNHNDKKEIDRLWREHGGCQHGPRTETMTIPRSSFFEFCEALVVTQIARNNKQ
jgi:hypothetical protein